MDFTYFTIDVLSSDEAEIEKVRFAAKFTHLLSFQICNKYRPIQCSDLFYHCEGSRGLGPRFGLRLGLRLGLTFNCIQSFKSRLFEPLFLATFKVFFTVNEQ